MGGCAGFSNDWCITTSPSYLNVRSKFIGDEEANLLAQTLRVNTSLFYLDLSVEGANSLAQTFGVNTSLSSLDLDSNSIGDKGANSFAQTFRVNTSLSSLDLGSNSLVMKEQIHLLRPSE